MSRPFDEARYRGLLEGLEAVEVTFRHSLAKERIDAEGFGKTEARFLAMLSKLHCEELATFAEVSDGNHMSIAEDFSATSGVRYLRGQDISADMMLDDKNAVFIPDGEYAKLARSHIFTSDVLITIVGANTGQTALVDEAPNKLTANCKLGIVRARPQSEVPPEYLHVFLASRFGQFQVQQSKRGAGQTGLILPDLKALLIPRFSGEFEQAIAEFSRQAHKAKRESKAIFEHAEVTLLRTLGLENWQPPEPLTYTRASRDAFAAGRLDAEYFAPRVAELLHRLSRDGLTVGEVAPVRHERFALPSPAGGGAGEEGAMAEYAAPVDQALFPLPSPPPAGEGTQGRDTFDYIEIGGVRADGTAVSETVPQAEAPSRATWLVHSGDVITSTVRPIRRLSALVAPEQDGYVCSSGFVVLRPEAIPAEVLLTYLRLPPVCELLALHTSASLYPAISETDLLAMPMPRIDAATQAQVVAAVRAAQASRRRAAELLDAAKRAVEIAIKDSEAAALAWLEQAAALAEPPISCHHASQEPHHDHPATATPRPTSEAMARRPSGRGQPAGGVSRPGAGVHPEFDGAGERAGGAQGGGSLADSTRPLDATRELATAAGSLTYTQVSERLAAQVADCLDELLDVDPQDIAITPDWLRGVHQRIAGELFPDWAGRFRSTDVQVGTHFPPPAHAVAVQVRDFCLDLEERQCHLSDAESIANLLAWVDWRFQWIHPFKDFNGRVGRILLVALAYKLGLPPMDPADVKNKDAYFSALREADTGDPLPLRDIWFDRLKRSW